MYKKVAIIVGFTLLLFPTIFQLFQPTGKIFPKVLLMIYLGLLAAEILFLRKALSEKTSGIYTWMYVFTSMIAIFVVSQAVPAIISILTHPATPGNLI
jgi:hypothetical protein